jgi:uncharacterized membrane protein
MTTAEGIVAIVAVVGAVVTGIRAYTAGVDIAVGGNGMVTMGIIMAAIVIVVVVVILKEKRELGWA